VFLGFHPQFENHGPCRNSRAEPLVRSRSKPDGSKGGFYGIRVRRCDQCSRNAEIKARLQQELVIGGFTEGKGGRKQLGALLLGAYGNRKLRYLGHSGRGFSEEILHETLKLLRPHFIDKSPFVNPTRLPEKSVG